MTASEAARDFIGTRSYAVFGNDILTVTQMVCALNVARIKKSDPEVLVMCHPSTVSEIKTLLSFVIPKEQYREHTK